MGNFTVYFTEAQINFLQPYLSSNYCDSLLSVIYPHYYLPFLLLVSSMNFASSNSRFSSRSAIQHRIHEIKDQPLKDPSKDLTYSDTLRHSSCLAFKLFYVDSGFSVKMVITFSLNTSEKSIFSNCSLC